MPSPNQRGYIAHKKYAMVADLLGLGGHTIEEKVKNLVAATEQLLDQLGIPRSIADLGISKEEFERAMPDLVKIAFDDPSWRSNPRMPLMSELAELFWSAYQGRGLAKVAKVSLSNKPRREGRCVWQRYAEWLKIDEERVVQTLQEAVRKAGRCRGRSGFGFLFRAPDRSECAQSDGRVSRHRGRQKPSRSCCAASTSMSTKCSNW